MSNEQIEAIRKRRQDALVYPASQMLDDIDTLLCALQPRLVEVDGDIEAIRKASATAAKPNCYSPPTWTHVDAAIAAYDRLAQENARLRETVKVTDFYNTLNREDHEAEEKELQAQIARLQQQIAEMRADKSIDLPGCVKPDTMERVHFYENDFYPLSNFSAFKVELDDCQFDTSEHAYHWYKFNTTDTAVAEQIYLATSAHEAFKVAERNKASRRSEWDSVKLDVMRRIIRAKADQHEYVYRKLLQTGDRELVEDSWRDNFWGWGPNRDGQNMLGKLWMELRAELRAKESSNG